MPTSRLLALASLLAAFGCSAETVPTPSTGTRGGGSGSGGPKSPVTTTSPIAAGSGSSSISNPSPGTIPSTGVAPSNPSLGSGTGGAGASCAKGMQIAAPVTPTVWLIVDGSSSMEKRFEAGRSRWQALRSTLMDPGGVVDSLQSAVRFGMVIYAGGANDPTQCVQLITVNPALNNLSMLASQYPMQPVANGTPTDKALDHVVMNLPILGNTGMLDMQNGPTYVVLATDGSPNDMCGGLIGGGGRGGNAAVEQRVIDVTTMGTKMGMNMFVISLAGDDTRLQSHLDLVAAATISKTPPYAPSTQNDLIAAFRKIVGGATCQVALDGTVKPGKECSGSVRLNTTPLKCNDPDGWTLSDSRTVQLTGTACNTFQGMMQSVVFADFPCEAFSPD